MAKLKKKSVLGGIGLGLINGFFGGGGGMIAVPILTDVLGYKKKNAHATAILIIAPICAVSIITYIVNGFIDLSVIIPATVGNVAGGLLGAKFLGKMSGVWVEILFIAVMAVAGIRMAVG